MMYFGSEILLEIHAVHICFIFMQIDQNTGMVMNLTDLKLYIEVGASHGLCPINPSRYVRSFCDRSLELRDQIAFPNYLSLKKNKQFHLFKT